MSVVIADSASCRLVEVPQGGPLSGRRVGVPAGLGAAACLMMLRTADGEIRAAVQAVPLAEVPSGFVAVGDDLTAEWDIDLDAAEWALERVDPMQARSLVLELPTERDPGDAAREIAASGLAGELLWVPPDGDDVTLLVGDLPYRVRELDVSGRKGVVARLTRDTRVEVYASAVRSGVDMVILADCSGSMGVDDIPLGAESLRAGGGRGRWMRRTEALQQALRELLDMRLQIAGRVSRVALVEFNTSTWQRFPREQGMAELDGGSPANVVERFRSALTLLQAQDGTGTDIGNALHYAANLLYQHGHEGNERLIVLVSDGANWVPKGEQGSGEMVDATKEPVSLMAHLHRDMSIRLHAIGISTADLFHRRGAYAPNPSLVPNHDLLEELVKVGGGDPTTIGGLDILEDYFSGLGAGITHRVPEFKERRAAGPLPQAASDVLSRLSARGSGNLEAQRAGLSYQIVELIGQCNVEALRALGGPAWDAGAVVAHFQSEVTGQAEAVARFLARAADRLRPNPPGQQADFISELARPLRELLDKLASASRDRPNLVTAYRAEFGFGGQAPAAILVDGITRLHDEVARLHESLRRLPDAIPQRYGPPAPPGDPGAPTGFVYRD